MLIGVTGCIGAGKSCVARMLGTMLDGDYLSADQICAEMLKRDKQGYTEVVDLWGKKFLDEQGDIDRERVRKKVFNNREIRQQLESILHPLVRTRLKQLRDSKGTGDFIVAEVPLLFETGWEEDFDWVVSVYVPSELSVSRVMMRDKMSEHDVRAILAAQLAPEIKRDRADSVIDNTRGRAHTKKQVRNLVSLLQQSDQSISAE